MSAVPPEFSPQTSFSTLAQQPISSTGLPGSELDGEFSRAADSINQINDRLSEIQRDDGKLRNGVVNTDSLSADVKSLILLSGVKPATWTLSGQFAVGDLVSNPPGTLGTYLCIVAHTSSSVFANDIANWAVIAVPPVAGVLQTNSFTGDGTSTNFTLSDEPIAIDATQVFIDGIYQPKTGYSVSGTLLTITPAPSVGSDIEAVIGTPSTFNLITVTDGTISTSKLGLSAVTTPKIAPLAVTEAKLADAAVSSAKLAALSVSTIKLTDSAVTSAKLALLAVTTDKVANDAITTAKIAPLAVSTEKIANNSITAAKIAANAVTTEKISDLSITPSKIAAGAIELSKLADGVISSDKIASGAIIPSKLAVSSVIGEKIADAAIVASKLNGAQSGTAPIFGIRAWAKLNPNPAGSRIGAYKSGNYSRTLTETTVTIANHGLKANDKIRLDFTTGNGTDGLYTVTSAANANEFVVNHTGAVTSGSVTAQFIAIQGAGNISTASWYDSGDNRVVLNFADPMPNANYATMVTGQYFPGAWATTTNEDTIGETQLNTANQAHIYMAYGNRFLNVIIVG